MRVLKRSSSNSRDTRKIRKILNEEARLGISANSDSEPEEVDLKKDLYPLNHYINNREEMIEQMFLIIKGAKLKKMLPPILKDVPLDELKADCLIHLLGMSKKRINAILEGKEINSSSESETHSDSSASPGEKTKTNVRPIVIKQEGCSDISDNSEEVVLVNPDLELLDVAGNSCVKTKRKLKRKHIENESKNTVINITEENLNKSDQTGQSDGSHESSSESENDNEIKVPTEGKTLLEILELEMRARAIRALLEKGGTPDCEDDTEEPTQSTIDLKDKSNKQLKESKNKAEKITPVRNFRKKKRKSDDVIVITPKVVTIDLTDENDPCNMKKKATEERQEHKGREKSYDGDRNIITEDCTKTPQSRQNTEVIFNRTENKTVTGSIFSIKEQNRNNDPTAADIFKKVPVQDNSENLDQAEQPRSSWAQRWLESKEVKKVVSTSKICGNIRKRIKNAQLAKKNKENSPKIPTESQEIQGSVGEYELLPKSNRLSEISVVEATENNDSQVVTSLFNVEKDLASTTQVETNAIFSREQVQDVTSTKSENLIKSSLQKDISSSSKMIASDITQPNTISQNLNVHGLALKTSTCKKPIDSTNLKVDTNDLSEINKIDMNPKPYESDEYVSSNTDVNSESGTSDLQMIGAAVSVSKSLIRKMSPIKEDSFSIEIAENSNCQTDIQQLNTNSITVEAPAELYEYTSKIKNDTKQKLSEDDKFDKETNPNNVIDSDSEKSNSQYSSIEISSESALNLQEVKHLNSKTNKSAKTKVTNFTLLKNEAPGKDLILTQELLHEPETLEININDEDLEMTE